MDPARLILDIAAGITNSANCAVANQEECKVLADLARQTTSFVQQLENRPAEDPLLEQALDLILEAMREAQSTVVSCCNSTFFTGMLCARKHSEKLQQAARKLEYALGQLPLASAGMTVEMQNELGSLKEELRRARFDQAAAVSHQMRTLKTEMERAFTENRQGTAEMKAMIEDMLKEHSATVEERMQDLTVLKRFAEEARQNKETQDEFELNQLMEVIAESIKASMPPQSTQPLDVESHLCCPISRERMVDPVILKDSGITYDRSSIVEWMKRGHRFDPLTRTEIKSGELVPNVAIRGILQTLSLPTNAMEADTINPIDVKLEPGVYEGNGTYDAPNGTPSYFFTVLVLMPDGTVEGYFFPENEDESLLMRERRISGGWYDNENLSYSDADYVYRCSIKRPRAFCCSAFSIEGVRAPLEHPSEMTSSLSVPCLRSTASQLPYRPRPGLVQMDGFISAANGRQQWVRIAVVLDASFRLRGWIQVKSESREWITGEVVDGSWSTSDVFTFELCFSPEACPGVGSSIAGGDGIRRFKMIGDLSSDSDSSDAQFDSLTGTCKCVSGTSPEKTSFLGISVHTPGTFSIRWAGAPSVHPTSRGLSLLLTPQMSNISGKGELPRFARIWSNFTLTSQSDVFYLQCKDWSRYLSMDRMDALNVRCIWHRWRNISAVWKLEKASNLDEYYIGFHGRPEDDDVHAAPYPDEGYMSVYPDPKRQTEMGCPYAIVTQSSEKSDVCSWRLERVGTGWLVAVATHGDPDASILVGHYLAFVNNVKDNRDANSYYARMSSRREKAIPFFFEPYSR